MTLSPVLRPCCVNPITSVVVSTLWIRSLSVPLESERPSASTVIDPTAMMLVPVSIKALTVGFVMTLAWAKPTSMPPPP